MTIFYPAPEPFPLFNLYLPYERLRFYADDTQMITHCGIKNVFQSVTTKVSGSASTDNGDDLRQPAHVVTAI